MSAAVDSSVSPLVIASSRPFWGTFRGAKACVWTDSSLDPSVGIKFVMFPRQRFFYQFLIALLVKMMSWPSIWVNDFALAHRNPVPCNRKHRQTRHDVMYRQPPLLCFFPPFSSWCYTQSPPYTLNSPTNSTDSFRKGWYPAATFTCLGSWTSPGGCNTHRSLPQIPPPSM